MIAIRIATKLLHHVEVFVISIWISFLLFYYSQAGSRKVLLEAVPSVWHDVSRMIKAGTAATSPLLRKFLVKLTQRIGLTCLPHRTPSWRYVVSIA